ncbi:MAG TPA: ABC transporter substrate-binding protein [Ktedonobacteraceae bacterium]|nr:ABC transporter substrate-binding protein [Ktedonobacteraceae bacterium]
MIFPSSRKRTRRSSVGLLCMVTLVMLSLLLVACNSSGGSTMRDGATPVKKTSIALPSDLLQSGVLTIGTDTTYPPQEYIDPVTRKAAGFDVDLITMMAARIGLKVNVITTDFTTIIDSLVNHSFDIVVSAVSITPELQKKVDFVPYLNAGESLLVQKGNPHNLKTVADLCGQNVGVQKATVELSELTMASKDCVNKGKKPITMVILQNQTDLTQFTNVVQLLTSNRVVATYQDSPVTDYYIKQNPGLFEVGGTVVNVGLEGIAVRKGDTSMFRALQAAFKALKADGTYHQLILKWGLTNEEISS